MRSTGAPSSVTRSSRFGLSSGGNSHSGTVAAGVGEIGVMVRLLHGSGWGVHEGILPPPAVRSQAQALPSRRVTRPAATREGPTLLGPQAQRALLTQAELWGVRL